jgi:hypothetical protein
MHYVRRAHSLALAEDLGWFDLTADLAAGEVVGVDVDVELPGTELVALGRREDKALLGNVAAGGSGNIRERKENPGVDPSGAGPWMWDLIGSCNVDLTVNRDDDGPIVIGRGRYRERFNVLYRYATIPRIDQRVDRGTLSQ